MPLNNPATFNEVNYPEVATYADLPVASDNSGKIYLVKTTTGVIFVNHKRAGLYLSDGINWTRMGAIQLAGESVGYLPSNPPSGKCVITNIFVNPQTGKTVVLYDNTPME